jgi:hypothetical protein
MGEVYQTATMLVGEGFNLAKLLRFFAEAMPESDAYLKSPH